MVPVSLSLTNFLSYGTSAPVLDFESFQVACLSGANGQGKSALLDAITWALWGEARKSSASRKPDEELIRIGARRMQVEFVFELETERYRVIRSYTRTASGKTSYPELELSIQDPTTGDFRPLTAGSLRETQQRLDQTLGIDYDTFINSAFLLQGRSDEFTKKKPSERKEILTRILGLDRFDELAQRARERERDALERQRQAEGEIERLTTALEPEPEWRLAVATLDETIRSDQARVDALRATERRLSEQLAVLEAKAVQERVLGQRIERAQDQIGQMEQDERTLIARIDEAERLIAEQDAIKRDYERYEKLLVERDDLDTRRDLARGIELQIQQKENERKDRRTELEKKLHSAEVEYRSVSRARDDAAALVTEAPAVRRLLEQARQAQEQARQMAAVRQQRLALSEQVQKVEQSLVGLRESLKGQVTTLREQIERRRAAADAMPALLRRRDALLRAVQEEKEVLTSLDETRAQGTELAERIQERRGQVTARKAELVQQQEKLARFLEASDGICPTCGTELGEEHCREVEEHYRQVIGELQRAVRREEEWIRTQDTERERLRARFRELEKKAERLKGCAGELGGVQQELKSAEQAVAEIEGLEAQAAEIERQIAEKQYGSSYREQWRALRKSMEALPFDEAAYETARSAGDQVERYEEQLRSLEEASARQVQLDRNLAAQRQQIASLREELDSGLPFRELNAAIEGLRQSLSRVGFDPERLDTVRRDLRDLAQAGARIQALVNAQQNREEWRDQIEALRERLIASREEHRKLDQDRLEIRKELEARDRLTAEKKQATDACATVDAQLSRLLRERGELEARLDLAAENKKRLTERKGVLAEAKAQAMLYKHLRAAFGKDGIPSLIIEQTLPEIEDRANALLERLTDGHMHVRLETLRDKKSGGTRETLEINITDDLGSSRYYETFSGGEAFRVNFALRIALAQLLAERSGVRIRTLVIDEGFGTQDAQGVQSLVDSIQAIRDDFDKILVITHLEQMKEAFPVRIEVTKDPVEGSRFEVIGV